MAAARDGRRLVGPRLFPPRLHRFLFLVIAACVLDGALARAARSDDAADSVRVRFEVGATTDMTNEQFYEDAFIDSVALGRRLVSSPESRAAAVLFGALSGRRRGGDADYRLQGEAELGDKIQRAAMDARWRADPGPDWRLTVAPRLEYRHDRTFDRDLEEWRGSGSARLRRALSDAATFVELQAGADFLRSSGEGALFLLDRNAARIATGLEHAPLFGAEWRIGYALAARSFPDSTERDHLEHAWEGRWRRDFDGGHALELETEGMRRTTLNPAPTSRDRFWQGEATLVGSVRSSERVAWRGRLAFERMRYDVEDDVLFYNYDILGARLTPALERGAWTLGVGPRAEWLRSVRDPTERYREVGGVLELEYLGRGAWWSVTPAAGWRDYSEATPRDTSSNGPHSSFAFWEINLLAEQPITGAMRLRMFASARLESHIDAAEDARSLYFSLDLRRLF